MACGPSTTALEVRTTGSWLTWRLWIEGSGDTESPRVTVEDDLATDYRAETDPTEWSSDGDRTTAEGQTLIVPIIATGARTLTVRLVGFDVDAFERRFPGARARERVTRWSSSSSCPADAESPRGGNPPAAQLLRW